MKVFICSDLHCEFHPDGGWRLIRDELPAADMAIVAGDLSNTEGLPIAVYALSEKYPQVVYVSGNHDYYGGSLKEIQDMRESAPDNFHWLENEVWKWHGLCFAGCTLWYGKHPLENRCLGNDFKCIQDLPTWFEKASEKSLKFLRSAVTQETIVITHLAPSKESLPIDMRHRQETCFIYSPQAESIIESAQPHLWIHGHTHNSSDYTIGKTRILCNPYGYQNHNVNTLFKYSLFELLL